MQIATMAQLSAALDQAGIALLELRGPGVLLRLGRDAAEVADAAAGVNAGQPGTAMHVPQHVAASSSLTVNAPSVGVFLHAHPLHAAPLAPRGTRVPAGAAIGLLQIGALLLPVRAPRAATVAELRVAHGATVGYGTPLVDLVAD